jgi:pyruvate formate lyase activating enzyme
MSPATLQQFLSERTAEGKLYQTLSDNRVECRACAHRCRIREDQQGICKVRFNVKGRLRVPFEYVAGLQVDPIEKKPFFHALPGAKALSFGMLGCDYHCDFCQNWFSSQALREPASEGSRASVQDITASEMVKTALNRRCRVVTSTYNEPLITSEWAAEVFREARANGLLTSYVSNGNATKEALEFLRPCLDLYKVDLKCFNDRTYRKVIGGPLRPVLETIERAKAMGFWVEVVTLVVPGMNDSEAELKAIAKFLASVSEDIPWHVTAFYPQYKMEDKPLTDPQELGLAYQIGKSSGLRYVYSGNRPGEVGATENTYCHQCQTLLIERVGFMVTRNLLGPKGKCPQCSTAIPGVWEIPSREANAVVPVADTPVASEALRQSGILK